MSDEGFFSWLLRQVARSDQVGVIARVAMQDSNMPIHPPARIRGYLESKAASACDLAAFDAAVTEWSAT